MKKIKTTNIKYQYTYKILYSLQLIIVNLAVLIISVNIFINITKIATIKNILESFLAYIVMGIPLFTSLGLIIDFSVLKRTKHVLLVITFMVLLSLFYLFSL